MNKLTYFTILTISFMLLILLLGVVLYPISDFFLTKLHERNHIKILENYNISYKSDKRSFGDFYWSSINALIKNKQLVKENITPNETQFYALTKEQKQDIRKSGFYQDTKSLGYLMLLLIFEFLLVSTLINILPKHFFSINMLILFFIINFIIIFVITIYLLNMNGYLGLRTGDLYFNLSC